jgi:predicted Zn-dependent peptidase
VIAAGAAARRTGIVTAAAAATSTPSGSTEEPLRVVGQHDTVTGLAASEHRLTELDSGLRVATEAMPAVRSVSLGFWIGTGSRNETDAQAGLSHLLEHLLFKGSSRYASVEIDQIFDAMGGELNAGTGKESTSVYARVLGQHVARAFDVIADMVFRPALREIDSERAVILEEIASYEDEPQEKVFDVLGESVFEGHPLGRAIIGRAEVIAHTPPAEIASFHAGRYVPANIVIAAAGAVEHDEIVALARRHTPSAPTATAAGQPPTSAPEPIERGRRFERKDTEQFHVCAGGPGLCRHDERRFALRVLDTILGGTSSSRVFQEVREKRGLAYSVYSFVSSYQDAGEIGIYLGTRGEHLAEALAVIGGELSRLLEEPVTAAELARAKENLTGRVLLSLESTSARMNRLGSELLAGSPLLSPEEVVARIEQVTLEDLHELSRELWAKERLTLAAIGPDEAQFQGAVEGLMATAAATRMSA